MYCSKIGVSFFIDLFSKHPVEMWKHTSAHVKSRCLAETFSYWSLTRWVFVLTGSGALRHPPDCPRGRGGAPVCGEGGRPFSNNTRHFGTPPRVVVVMKPTSTKHNNEVSQQQRGQDPKTTRWTVRRAEEGLLVPLGWGLISVISLMECIRVLYNWMVVLLLQYTPEYLLPHSESGAFLNKYN